jgi:hypothetical protein
MCLLSGTNFNISFNTDSPAVTPMSYGWSQGAKSSNCPSSMMGVTVNNTVYGAYLGGAKITAIVMLYPPGSDSTVTKLIQYDVLVYDPNQKG